MLRIKSYIFFTVFLIISNNASCQNRDTCFLMTKNMDRAKGLNIYFPYLCNWQAQQNRSPDAVLFFDTEKTLVSQMLIIQKGVKIDDFFNENKISEIKKSFSTNTDKVLSIKKTNYGFIKAWEINMEKYGERTVDKNLTYDRLVDYIFLYKDYYVSVVFTCTSIKAESYNAVSRFKKYYSTFQSLFSKVRILN